MSKISQVHALPLPRDVKSKLNPESKMDHSETTSLSEGPSSRGHVETQPLYLDRVPLIPISYPLISNEIPVKDCFCEPEFSSDIELRVDPKSRRVHSTEALGPEFPILSCHNISHLLHSL
jgi:hypothetical protein